MSEQHIVYLNKLARATVVLFSEEMTDQERDNIKRLSDMDPDGAAFACIRRHTGEVVFPIHEVPALVGMLVDLYSDRYGDEGMRELLEQAGISDA